MKTKKVFTKKPLALRSFRVPYRDVEAWQAAAAKLGVSQSEFLRQTLLTHALEVLERSEREKPKVAGRRDRRMQR
jgi:uncharacterized protein (DUF1778 family)